MTQRRKRRASGRIELFVMPTSWEERMTEASKEEREFEKDEWDGFDREGMRSREEKSACNIFEERAAERLQQHHLAANSLLCIRLSLLLLRRFKHRVLA